MVNHTQSTKSISLENYGIENAKVHYQLEPSKLQEITVEKGMGKETANGTLAINTGKFTGRSPEDRFLVKDDYTKDRIWWGKSNKAISPEHFDLLQSEIENYLSGKEIYARDGYVCADPNYKMNVRTITEYPWSNMFVYNMFLRPSEEELKDFKEEWLVLCAPGYECPTPEDYGLRQGNFSILNFTKKIALVGGSAYTGEMKKGIFTALNFILPVEKNVLPMHCSANVGENGETAIFFGLSGTGKTTLSTDQSRKLIGDDEHGWTAENTVFNFEGGCYAKAINLSEEQEPEIFGAIKPGALLENIIMDDQGIVDFADTSITQNTRVSYPIYHIDNIQQPSIGNNPKNKILDSMKEAANIARKYAPVEGLKITEYTSRSGFMDSGLRPLITKNVQLGSPGVDPELTKKLLKVKLQILQNHINKILKDYERISFIRLWY